MSLEKEREKSMDEGGLKSMQADGLSRLLVTSLLVALLCPGDVAEWERK